MLQLALQVADIGSSVSEQVVGTDVLLKQQPAFVVFAACWTVRGMRESKKPHRKLL